MESNRSILEFSALSTVLLAHDLQNLLSIMSACAASLAGRTYPNVVDRDLTELNEAIDSAFRLSGELLAAVGLQQTGAPPVIDAHELIMRYQGMMRRLVGEEVSLAINVEARPAPIEAAPVHLEWTLLHLLADARDTMPSGGTIYLNTTRVERWSGPLDAPVREERYLELTIRDEGDGADGSDADVVEPFFTTNKGAIGLGLTSVAATVRLMKGWLYVDRHEPAGRTVHVLLPLYFGPGASGTSI